jgi:spore maturation protein CgeB
MCAGGLYLTNATKGLDEVFKINKAGEPVTADQDLVVYYSANDLVEKIDFLLEHESIRVSIAHNGQNTVLENHKFVDRIAEMINKIEKEMK